MIPRYLTSDTMSILTPEIVILPFSKEHSYCCFFIYSWKQERFSHLEICSSGEMSLAAANCFVLACTYINVSSAYSWVLERKENSSGLRIDPCGTPV